MECRDRHFVLLFIINTENDAEKKMRPVIGVTPYWDNEKERMWLRKQYCDSIAASGGAPVIFPLTDDESLIDQLTAMCDGFMFTGGQDVSPSMYFEEPSEALGEVSEERDLMESAVLKRAIEQNKPVLGICRGFQFINAYLGGSLYQDLPTQFGTEIGHYQKEPYPVPTHQVWIDTDTPLYKLLGEKVIAVNSFHHQGIKKLAPRLIPMAGAPDGLIEAYYRPGPVFFRAVQWHPEMMYGGFEHSRKLFGSFVEAVISNR